MSWDEDYPEWFRRRRRFPFFRSWFFEDIDEMFREFERMIEREMKELTSGIPKESGLMVNRKSESSATFSRRGSVQE